MSDCEQIRFYIQQQFDIGLSFEDEQAVLAHLNTCDLCTRYRNQIEQVIVFAQDLPLAEEYLPTEYEMLVSRVAGHLPKPSQSALSMILNFFGQALGLRPKGTSLMKPLEPEIQTPFPHANRTKQPQAQEVATSTPVNTGTGILEVLSSKPPVPVAPPELAVPRPAAVYTEGNAAIRTPSVQAAESLTQTTKSAVQWQPPVQEKKVLTPAAEEINTAQKSEIVPVKNIVGRLSDVLEGKQATIQPKPATPPAPGTAPSQPQTPLAPLQPSTPPTSPVPPADSEPSDSHAGLLKGIGDVYIDNLFTQTLGVAPEVASAVVHKQPTVQPTVFTETTLPSTDTDVKAEDTVVPSAEKSETNSNSLFLLDDDTMDRIFAENLGIESRADELPIEKIKLEEAITSPLASNEIETTVPESEIEAETNVPDINAAASSTAPSDTVESNTTEASTAVSDMAETSTPDTGAVETEATVPELPPPSTQPPTPSLTQPPPPPIQPIPLPTPRIEIEGLGRLDKHTAAHAAGPSQINAIGKFLLDKQDIQNLEKLAQSNLTDTGLRVLTPDASQELQALLERIRVVGGVMGSVIVGHDGILVSTDFPSDVDADSIAVWSLGIYLNTGNAIKKMGRNSVKQLIAQTTKGHLAIADFGTGILSTITTDNNMNTIVGVMRVINELVSSN